MAPHDATRVRRYTVQRHVAGALDEDLDDGAKRAASYQIIKNRGLTAYKSKLNRNPRAKKREQYRRAQIRRKGQVRDIRDAAEGANYGGEASGIRARISRSRSLKD